MVRLAQVCGMVVVPIVLWFVWSYIANAQHILWAFRPPRETLWTGYGSSTEPEIHGNVIYYSGGYRWENQVYIYAIEKNSGKFLWKSPFPVETWRYSNGKIFATSMEGNHRNVDKTKEHWKVHGLDAGSGKILWEQQAPIVLENLLLLGIKTNIYFSVGTGADSSVVFALNPGSGEYVWKRTFPRVLEMKPRNKYFSCSSNGDTVSARTPDGSIVTIDGVTGKDGQPNFVSDPSSEPRRYISSNGRWYSADYSDGHLTAVCLPTKESLFSIETGTPTSPFVVVGNFLVFGTVVPNRQAEHKDCYVTVIDLANKNVRWNFKTRNLVDHAPLVRNGVVYAGMSFPDQRFYALELVTGRKLWETNLGPVDGYDVPVLNNDTLYVNGWKKLSAADCKTGRVLWTFKPDADNPSGSPVLDQNVLYLSAEDGNLYALKLPGN